MTIVPSDLPILLENLKPEGVLYQVFCKSEKEADELVEYVKKHGA